jgi:glycosyltransferase involved in cell wall biosynthesis
VATDVGDAGRIVGDAGWLVPAANPAALHETLRSALGVLASASGAALRERCRERIVHHFSDEKMASAFSDTWLEAMRQAG